MGQITLSDAGFENYRKKTRKAHFLDGMEKIIPWKGLGLAEAIEPFHPKPKGAGRRPIGIERMLRLHFLLHWFSLSEQGAGESRTPVRHHQAAIRFYEGGVLRVECSSTVCGLCAEQPGDGETGSFETKTVESAGYVRLNNENGEKSPEFSSFRSPIPVNSFIQIH